MPSTTIKSTYSLDVDTVRKLEAIARRWNVSKSEALRRAIRSAATPAADGGEGGLKALDALQAALNLDARSAAQWEDDFQQERRSRGDRLSET